MGAGVCGGANVHRPARIEAACLYPSFFASFSVYNACECVIWVSFLFTTGASSRDTLEFFLLKGNIFWN